MEINLVKFFVKIIAPRQAGQSLTYLPSAGFAIMCDPVFGTIDKLVFTCLYERRLLGLHLMKQNIWFTTAKI